MSAINSFELHSWNTIPLPTAIIEDKLHPLFFDIQCGKAKMVMWLNWIQRETLWKVFEQVAQIIYPQDYVEQGHFEELAPLYVSWNVNLSNKILAQSKYSHPLASARVAKI